MKSQFMKRCLVAFSLLAVLGIVVACQKEDDTSGLIEVIAEPMNGAKVLVNGSTGSWVDGDAIRINDEVATVQHRNGSAYISATSQSVNRAVYPASLYDGSLTSDAVTLSFPKIYHYRTDDSGHQLLELPMAACSQSGSQLKFYHLTGALYIKITNTSAYDLHLQSITLFSNSYQLSGSRSIDFSKFVDTCSDGNRGMLPRTGISGDDKKVTMVFDNGYLLTAGSDPVYVMLPIMPVDTDNRFSVQIKSYKEGESESYQNSRTQSESGDHSLSRNQLGYVPMDVDNTETCQVFERSGNYYLISSPFEFELMVQFVNNGSFANKYFRIDEDLDMNGITVFPMHSFGGILEGYGHTISNLTIQSVNSSENNYCALFDIYNGGTVANLTLDNLVLKHNGNIGSTEYLFLGGIYAKSAVSISISNCSVIFGAINLTGSIEGYLYFGGIIGEASSTITINNCYVTTDYFSSSTSSMLYWGGLIGRSLNKTTTTINNSSWHGSSMSIDAARRVTLGGFVGYKADGSLFVSDCNVEGSVTAEVPVNKYYYLGSVVGQYYSVGENSITGTRSFTANIKETASNYYTEISLPDYNYSLKRDNNP